MQLTGAEPLQLVLEPGPHGRVGAGEVHGVDGALDVEPGAPDEHGGAALGEQPVDLRPGQPLVLGDAGGLLDVPDVQQVVRHALPLLHGQFGGADVHAAVELHGVGVDDLAPQVLGEGDAEIGLACRRGTDDGDDPGCGSCVSHCFSLPNLGGAPRTSDVTRRDRVRCLLRGPESRFADRRP